MLKRFTAFIIASLLALSLFAGIGVSAEAPQDSLECKNVILLIASGVSPEHITAAAIKTGKHLNMQDFAYTGTLETSNSDNAISDPAAAATALSTGKRTLNFRLGIDANGNQVELITEAAMAAGKKVGIITDKNLNDATTAAFSVHNELRSDYYGIARQQIESGIDLFLGGGSKYFDGYRSQFAAAGYDYVTTPSRLSEFEAGKKYFAAFSNYTLETGYNVPTVTEMFNKATELLDNENGFFIVCEGGLIDKYSFARNVVSMSQQLAKFDETVGAAMAYVDGHPDTLLVVVGDVEAGKLDLQDKPSQGNINNNSFKSYGTSKDETVLLTYGKNASAFTGAHENTDVPKFIASAMGIRDFALEGEKMSFADDYIVDELNSFSSWTFTNIKKNSHVSGITLNTTSSNNSAVTAMCSKGSLVIMANARVGFDLTVTSPLASPFKLKNGGSTDLSAYDGFVVVCNGLAETDMTLTVGKGDFSASAVISENNKNDYSEILLPFDSFEPAITAETAVGLDVFKISCDGCPSKSTIKIDSIHAYRIDEGLNYHEMLGVGYSKDAAEFTPASYEAFSASFEAFKAASTRADRYAAKLDLIEKIDALVPVANTAEDFGLLEANGENVGVSSAAVAVGEKGLDVLCGSSAAASVSFTNIPEKAGAYTALRLKLDSFYPDFTCGDFAIAVTFKTASDETTETVDRAIISEGNYYFPLSVAVSDINEIKVEFRNAAIGAVVSVNGAELISAAPAKSVRRPGALSILRAAVGIASAENCDMNGDGVVDVSDALTVLRMECGLA